MKGKLSKYVELTKPKVTLLNLLVGITCFVLAAFPSIDWVKLAVFSVAGYFAAGGCGVLNSVYDHDIDKAMPRTSKRAIPAGYVTRRNALFFGSALTALGLAISFFAFNVLTAEMMALGVVFYLAVYTVWLKRVSSWNVVIGGAAGCFAALSGWTAAVNALSLLPLLISAVGFLWTPGHLWGLAIKKVKEYRKAGIPMLPVTRGLRRAAQAAWLFNCGAVALSLLLSLLGLAGLLYSAVAVSAGAWFLYESRRLMVFPSEALGFRVFVVSMPYLACLMAGLVIDKIFMHA